MQSFWRDELTKSGFSIASTAVGVLIALGVNSCVERKKEREAYSAMFKAIVYEAEQNRTILNNSFIPNYCKKIIYREFSTKACEGFLYDKVFLENSLSTHIDKLTDYVLTLNRANKFRVADEKYKYDTALYNRWGIQLTEAFEHNLQKCTEVISIVSSMNHR